jgi:D-alanyl-D-alanine carboxypeptidase/D-alanyl-D-alanine-endopeptidase (penicillin-binding protein 4)
VAAAALDRLGPSYRFTTTVTATRPPAGGQVDSLWLIGAGDPLLASPAYIAYLHSNPATAGYPATPLASLADQLAAAGVRRVPGGLHGDDSRYEPLRYLPTWSDKINVGEFDIGPLGGLEVDQGLQQTRPDVPTSDPAGLGANLLAQLLTDRGGSVGSTTDQVAPPNTVVLAQVQSAPLAQIVTAMLQASDNQIAELLVREIDRQAGGNGTTAGGVKLVMAEAAQLGLPSAGLAMVDGSGLSPSNRVTCRTLLGALNLGDAARFATLNGGLPVAGVNGTMHNFLRGTPAAGRLAAKGGYITGVTALVGRITVSHPFRFAYIANGPFNYMGGLGLLEKVVGVLS